MSAQNHSSAAADTMTGIGAGAGSGASAGSGAVNVGDKGSLTLRAIGCLQRAHGRLGQKSPILRE